MPDFTYRGLRLAYHERGEGIPLLFLHGMGGSHRSVLTALDPLPGVRLIAPDMQGHGDSEVAWEEYGFGALADDAAALCDHLGIGEFFLGGISLGAAVSTALALRHPGRVKGLCLVRPAWTDEPMAPSVRSLYALCAQYLQHGDREGFAATEEFASLESLSAYTSGTLASFFADPASVRHYRKFQILPASAPYAASDLQGLPAVRTAIVACRGDLIHPYEYAQWHRRLIPGARLLIIPGKDTDPDGHRKHLNRCVRNWLGVVEATE